MKGIYLGAYEALHPGHDIVYQDINGKRDLAGDMLEIDISPYDYIIATPPCNYWSRARGKRVSQYALKTKHLLPDIINKLSFQNKPFIIENVRNNKRMTEENILPCTSCNTYILNRHIYFTNIILDLSKIEQRQDFRYGGKVIKYEDMENKKHQGGYNVHNVIEYFITKVENECEEQALLFEKQITEECTSADVLHDRW